MEEPFAEVSQAAINRYSERHQRHGYCAQTLGWGSREQQFYRFDQVLRAIDLQDRSILDIGCGFGDFYGYALDQRASFANYTGWDLNADLINEARTRFPNAHFDTVNVSARDEQAPAVAQVGIMLGLLNFNLGSTAKNWNFTKHLMRCAFSSVSDAVVIDFLSVYRTADYSKEETVFYHDPSLVIDEAMTLTSNIRVYHDYLPNPQKEFIVVLEK